MTPSDCVGANPTYLDENDRGTDCHQAIELAENVVFVLLAGAIHVHLGNALDGLIARRKRHLNRFRRELIGVAHDLVWESSREQQHLSSAGEEAVCARPSV